MPANAYRINLSNEEQDYLKSLIKTRTIQAQIVASARNCFGNQKRNPIK